MTKPQNGIRALRGRSYAELDSLASQWRHFLKSDLNEAFDAKHFFDVQLGSIELSVGGQTIDVVEHVATSTLEGFTRWDSENERLEVGLSEATHRRLQEEQVRARFTVCHEFGHAVLHTVELVRLAGLPLVTQAALHRQKLHSRCFDSEWQANAFAASLLMPARGVRNLERVHGYLTEDLIARHFEVSTEAAAYRLESLKKV